MELQTFVTEKLHDDKAIKKFLLTDEEWNQTKRLREILEPFYKYSVRLQSENTTLSDFYGFWVIIRIKTARLDDAIAIKLNAELEQREKMILHNPVILSAIYLDPRYQRALKTDEKQLAIFFLRNLYAKIETIEKNDVNIPTEYESSDSLDEINNYLDSIEGNSSQRAGTSSNVNLVEIEKILKSFDGTRESITNVSDYWTRKKTLAPELNKLASAIYSIPPTQTTVERCFSALAIVLTSRRSTLGDEILQNILINRLNPTVYKGEVIFVHYYKDTKHIYLSAVHIIYLHITYNIYFQLY